MNRRAIPYWHVDAFAARPFAGNQAAVMLVEQWPEDAQMLAIAAENLFAETAFLRKGGEADEADYELRWFTPGMEVALCGHATLAAGHVVLALDAAREMVCFQTNRAGLLAVRRCPEGYELALPAIHLGDEPPAGATAGLGSEPDEVHYCDKGYLLCLYRDEAAVRSLTPDMDVLMEHGDTMFIVSAPGDNRDVVSRVFVPGVGVPEDSATGSAHAVLTPFWAAKLGRESFTAHQASARGADIACRLDGGRAILGGQCTTVVEGRFYLEG